MPRRILFSLLAALLLVSIDVVWAARFKPKMNEPQSYKDARFGADEVRNKIESVDCGGFVSDTHVTVDGTKVKDGSVPLPDISPDVAGRENIDPLGSATGGLGIRGDYSFPDSAWGYISACSIYIEKNGQKMQDKDLQKMGKDLKMKIEGDVNDINSKVSLEVVDGDGYIDINPHFWCMRFDDYSKATPAWCRKLYDWFKLLSAQAPHPAANPACPRPPVKKYCFDDPYTKECNGQECRTTAASPEMCGVRLIPVFDSKLTECDSSGNISVFGYEYGIKSSFYRHYAGSYKEPGIKITEYRDPDGLNNVKEWDVRAECYEYYLENDPKRCVLDRIDEQCEFVVSGSKNNLTGEEKNDEQNPDRPEWADSDKRMQKEGYKPRMAEEVRRDARTVPEPWVADDRTNLSMVDAEKLKDLQKAFSNPADFSGIFGTMLPARQKAAMTTPDRIRTDMFDDTAERKLSNFWEDQQKELLKMTSNPTVKLVMPSEVVVGLSVNDPLFQFVRGLTSKSSGLVEMTLLAGPEDVGLLLASLTRNLMTPVKEVRIPLLVPLASEDEINTRIFEWRQWKMQEDRQSRLENRFSYSGMADPLIAKLQQYLQAVKKERLMRNALAKHLGRLTGIHTQIQNYIAQWYQANAGALSQSNGRTVQRKRLQWIWKQISRAMLQADECQLSWCGNQRYSVPVYSLLDNWWGDRRQYEKRNLDYLPEDLKTLDFEQPHDQLIDFSEMGFSTGGLKVPVLWPVQVKLRLPLPPTAGVPPSPEEFPDLPVLPDETIFDNFPVPTVNLPSPPPSFTPATTGGLAEAIRILREFRKRIDGKDIGAQILEEDQVLAGVPPPADDGPWEDRSSMRGAYCRFSPSIEIAPDDSVGNRRKIIHIENDLKERLARMFSRWSTIRLEDAGGRVARLNEDYPNSLGMDCHEDLVCLPLAPEDASRYGWQWFVTNATGVFDTLADKLQTETCPFCFLDPPDETKNPYLDAPTEILNRIFQRITLPVHIDLFSHSE